MIYFMYYIKRNPYLWPGAAHRQIEVKLNPQVYSVQQQIPAKFHPDRSTFGRMAPEKPVFGLQQRMAMPIDGGGALHQQLYN